MEGSFNILYEDKNGGAVENSFSRLAHKYTLFLGHARILYKKEMDLKLSPLMIMIGRFEMDM